jgi:ATP-dependent Clp protease ATP-binding subunit ClpC
MRIGFDRFTTGSQEAAQRAIQIMQRYGHHQIDTEILLLALIEQPQGGITPLLQFLKVDENALSERLDRMLRTGPPGEVVPVGEGQVSITPRLVQIIDLANEQAIQLGEEHISSEHIFLAIFDEHDTAAARLLEEAGLTRDRVYEAMRQRRA